MTLVSSGETAWMDNRAVGRPSESVDLASFWQQFSDTEPPFVHPADRDVALHQPYTKMTAVSEFVASELFGRPGPTLQLGLLPVPYAGDLAKANIFILLLNPGFDTVDIYGEDRVPGFRDAALRTLRQDLEQEQFPFMFLNPEFCWSGGYRWWERKLHDVALKLAEKRELFYRDALRELSKHLAAIELIPYHSSSRPSGALEKLPSAKAAKKFVQEAILPRGRNGEATLIVTRQVANWGVLPSADENDDIVIYDAGHARGASLSTTSRGGQAILKRLLGVGSRWP